MTVLVTNDDGIDSPGLNRLRHELMQVFSSVVTIAPERDSSGFSRSCTYKRRVRVTKVSGGAHPQYVCDGTPLDCVRVGLVGGVATDVSLVVSGINHGANLADDVAYSGTVGAGLEAGALGVRALCLSQQNPSGSFSVSEPTDGPAVAHPYDFSFTGPHAARLAHQFASLHSDDPTVLNVNYPARITSPQVVLTHLGRRIYPRPTTQPFSDGGSSTSMWLFGEPDDDLPVENEAGSDIAALRAGRIAATPLSWTVLGDVEVQRTTLARLLGDVGENESSAAC